ncbi:hypothetical protein K438DRAFT_1766966 [Mycena galopus ATCC 62051]|nr:hypothetical protein K438DRAFT_1766966 [Mycena galopus ATCC 62051]
MSLPPHLIPSTSSMSLHPIPVHSNPKQTTLQFTPTLKEDVQRYWRTVVEGNLEKRQQVAEQNKRCTEEKKDHKRDQGRELQRRKCLRDQESTPNDNVPDKKKVNKALMNGTAAADAGSSAIRDVADLSWSSAQGWKKSRNGTQGGAMKNGPSTHIF